MIVRQRFVGLLGASVLAVGLGLLGVGSAAADTSADAACVEPDASVFSFDRLSPTTYQVSLGKPGTVTCTDITFNLSSYQIPDTWDRDGYNETALPQTEFGYTALVFPAGGAEPVTATVAVPDCGPYQTDLYTGPRVSYLDGLYPHAGLKIIGIMVDQTACSQPAPASETPTTPAAATVAPTQVSTSPAAAPTQVMTSPAAAPTQDTRVLGAATRVLPKTGSGGAIGIQLIMATGLILLGVTLLAAQRKRAPVSRHRRH